MSRSLSSALVSMTGFAALRGRVGERRFLLEVKSVNHRFCEVNVRLPGRYAAWELPIHKEVKQYFRRGRFDLFIKEESRGVGLASSDFKQIQRAHQQLKRIARELKLPQDISMDTILTYKQNFMRDEELFDAGSDWPAFKILLLKLFKELQSVRMREGKQLARWFQQTIPKLEKLLVHIRRYVDLQPGHYQARLSKRIHELGLDTEKGSERLTAEVALLADKLDVTEELVRLEAHTKALKDILRDKEPMGRKIDFLMQEVGREVNTIAAKSQDTKVASLIVQFKTEIEKIREQAGNVE